MSQEIKIPSITIGKGLYTFGTGTLKEGVQAIGVYRLNENLKVGEKIPEGHGKELILILRFLNIEGLNQLSIAIDKVRKNLTAEQEN